MQFAVMAVVCAVAGGAAFADATIADDQSEGSALISGAVSFTERSDWIAHVDYAVYAPGQYPGDHADKDTNYIYAYQVFNDSGSDQATLSHFSVGLDDDSGAANPWWDDAYGELGGNIPMLSWLVGSPPGSIQWVGSWAPGTHTTVLLFSSPYTYTFDSATLVNGGQGDTHPMPSPLPEPATLLLLCGGVVPILLKHRRKARVKV